jgi:hypothetical protein
VSMLADLSWCLAGDTILIFHESMPTQRITRTGATTFDVASVSWETPGFGRVTDTAVTMQVSAVGVVGSTANFVLAGGAMTADWVGRWLRFLGKRATITSVTDDENGALTWQDDTTGLSGAATTDWQEQAWVPEYGYPSCGCVMDGRLWVAATTSQPSAIWASRVNAPYDFDLRTAEDADGIAENIGGIDSVPRVLHLAQTGRLLVLTDSGVWFLPSSDTRPVTPSTIAFRPVSEVGASRVRPAGNDGAIAYVDATGRVVREARWSDTLQTYTTDALTLLAEHLVTQPVASAGLLGSDAQPGRLLMLVNEDGTMAVQHSIAAERVNAWVPWETAGTFQAVAAAERTLFVVVVRDGTWRLERGTEERPALDAVVRATSPGKTRTFPGFSHLEGLEVGVVTNGHDLGDVTVEAGGNITLPSDRPAVTVVDVGLRFEQVIRPMPVDVDLPDGDAAGLRKRLVRILVQVHGSGDLYVKGTPVTMGFQGDDYDTEPAAFTGTKEVRAKGISRECQFDIEVRKAHRVTVLSLTREVSVDG